jgi:hypothetical protein
VGHDDIISEIDTSESKNEPRIFVVGSLVQFIGYNYTPDFMLLGDRYDELGIVVSLSYGGLVHRYRMYNVYWFKSNVVSKVPAGHIKLLSL